MVARLLSSGCCRIASPRLQRHRRRRRADRGERPSNGPDALAPNRRRVRGAGPPRHRLA